MKIKNNYSRLWLLSLLIIICLPLMAASAESNDETPDFVITLALMAVADDRLDGVMDLSALSNLRAVVNDYYTQKGYMQMDQDTAEALNHQKQVVLSSLDKKIQNQKTLTYKAQLGLFVAMADQTNDIYQQDPETFGDPYDVYYHALTSGYEPDPEAVAMLKARLSASTTDLLRHNLEGHIVSELPGGSALAGMNSSSVYDFDAGQSQDTAGTLSVQPRPLNFTNTGSRTVHVSVEYYQPPKDLAVGIPGMNVEVPGQGSVVMTGFPQGNYVFCVDWETNLDTNGDGQNDYDKAVVRGWVSSGHPADTQHAQVIHVNAGFSETPTGRCGGFVGEAPSKEEAMREAAMTEDDPELMAVEPTLDEPFGPSGEEPLQPTEEEPAEPEENFRDDDDDGPPGADFWDQDDDNEAPPTGYNLTSFEQANQGGHAFKVVCLEEGKMSDTMYEYMSINFSEAGVTIDGVYGARFYSRSAANAFENSDGSQVIFSSNGFSSKIWLSTETTSDGIEKKIYRHCKSLIND